MLRRQVNLSEVEGTFSEQVQKVCLQGYEHDPLKSELLEAA